MKKVTKHLITGIIIILIGVFASCDSAQDSSDAAQSGQTGANPSQETLEVAAVSADVTDEGVTLTWTDPAAQDVDHIEIACTNDSSLNQTVERGMRSSTIQGLVQGVAYTFRIRCVDADGGASDGVEVAVTCGGSDEAQTVYFIHTVEELNAVRGGVAGYEDWGLDKHYKLMADLDMSGYDWDVAWLPLGNADVPFTGIFDGNGHVISNLTMHSKNYDSENIGLFGCLGAEGHIENLTLENVYIIGARYTSFLVSENYGTIKNCSVQGKFFYVSHGGMLAGVNYSTGSIENCNASGRAIGYGSIGMITGDNKGTIIRCSAQGESGGSMKYIGGLAGINSGNISWSSFSGELKGYYLHNGGIAGHNSGTIEYCLVEGSVFSDYEVTGGIAGRNFGTVTHCLCQATVEGGSCTGGIAGENRGKIELTAATGSVTAMDSYTGGLVGRNINLVSQCLAMGTVTGTDYVGGLVGTSSNFGFPYNTPGIVQSGALGPVSGNKNVGGLVGSTWSGEIRECFTGIDNDMLQEILKIADDLKLQVTAASIPDNKCSSVPEPVPVPELLQGGDITATDGPVGGLVGLNYDADILNCYAGGKVSGGRSVGGLIGLSISGSIINCKASGSVTAEGNYAGGLVGSCTCFNISVCFATGDVRALTCAGGLMGVFKGDMKQCYASGTVASGEDSGGLVGLFNSWMPDLGVYELSSISDCYARGNVSGGENAGGLVGNNEKCNVLRNCYATGEVIVDGENAGGLVGYIDPEYYTEDNLVGLFYYQMPDNGIGTFVCEKKMKQKCLYKKAVWDFVGEKINGEEDIWSICSCKNDGFPYLTELAP